MDLRNELVLQINVNTTRLLLRFARMELQGCSVINDIWIYYLRENKLDNLFRALSVLLLKKKKEKKPF